MPVQGGFKIGFISFCCFFPACILAAYGCNYVLRPWLKRKRYLTFAAGLLSLIALILILNWFTAILFFVATCNCPLSQVSTAKFLALDVINSAHAFLNAGLLFGFTMTKDWIAEQKQSQIVARMSVKNKVQLEKTRIHPAFLFQSLHQLKKKMSENSPDSPAVVVKLSDILSYLLYESSGNRIRLDRELEMVKNMIDLEEINHSGHLRLASSITTMETAAFVQPLVLFSLLRNCFEAVRKKPDTAFSMDIQIRQVHEILSFILSIEPQGNSQHIDWSSFLNYDTLQSTMPGNSDGGLEIIGNRSKITLQLNLTAYESVS